MQAYLIVHFSAAGYNKIRVKGHADMSMETSAEERIIREFPDRGTLWLLESPENLRELIRLLAQELANRLDFSRAKRLNRSFVPDDLHKREAT